MRFFKTFKEMKSEVVRDLAELSVQVVTDTYQDKEIIGDPDMFTREAQNYTYTVTSPDLENLEPTQPWANMEFSERISSSEITSRGDQFERKDQNPGSAWTYRREIWEQFLEIDNKFSYTYGERLGISPFWIIEELKKRPTSRQLFIPIFWAVDVTRLADRRVPCSLGYWLNWRQQTLNMTYLQRSSDFFTHFENDVYLARRIQEWIAEQADLQPGTFTHWIGSLHVFERDVAHVF